MKIRRLGSNGRFFEFEDDGDECPWCEAAQNFFARNGDEEIVHLENERGGKRTVSYDEEGTSLQCEPYVFFRDD